MSAESTDITINTFYKKLGERVSMDNAKLLMQTAAVQAGANLTELEQPMPRDVIEKLCLELINNGGPSFQVGRSIYSEIQ